MKKNPDEKFNIFGKLTVLILCSSIMFVSGPVLSLAQKAQQEASLPEIEEARLASVSSGRITVDFKDADINTVLRIISLESGVNIVPGKDVRGSVTMRLIDIPWETALDAVLKTHGYTYERIGDVIAVDSVKSLTELKKAEAALYKEQPMVTEIFNLKFLNATDVAAAVRPLLSKEGKVTVLYIEKQRGWEFGVAAAGGEGTPAMGRVASELAELAQQGLTIQQMLDLGIRPGKVSKTLLVRDIPPIVERIRRIIDTMDRKPYQVFIETVIAEVSRDKLKDLGVDFSTGTVDPTSPLHLNPYRSSNRQQIGQSSTTNQIVPSAFTPVSKDIIGKAGIDQLFNTGLNLVFKKVGGYSFEVIIHALEEDAKSNILSAPKIRTLDGQEATILVGTKYPILSGETESTTGGAVATAQLDYYQNVGVELKVTPQVNADGYINMIVHPSVSTITGYVSAGVVSSDETGAIPIQYPILQVREAETQLLMKSGEVIAMGGLLKDAKSKSTEGIPFFKDIPIFGILFRRDTTDVEKIDLVIFITARVIEDETITGRDKVRYEQFRKLYKEQQQLEEKDTKKKKKR